MDVVAEDAQDTGRAGVGKSKKDKKDKKGSFWKELPILIVVALGLALVIKTFVVQAFYIPSESMENTFLVNDRVLVNKLVYHTRDIERGDVVVFSGADSWDEGMVVEEPSNPIAGFFRSIGTAFGVVPGEKDYIKRVIGVGGDTVECCDDDGRIKVNGVPIKEESYLFPNDLPSQVHFKAQVPPGRLWVMGDHRGVSNDSRAHKTEPGGGTIPEDHVIGRAFVIVWPLSRASVIDIPETFDQPALKKAAAVLTPATPLALGFAGAVPLMLIRRRWRARRAARAEVSRGPAGAAGAAGSASGDGSEAGGA
ncbi:signal peptidase I [Bailinhaonella thermotolerans]|uniref:Signal peptidase I n=1 Tax=Bailinhaonella thermotolerans TaxID=1070861 RepID=A0A3A4A2J5_9ACTN|nr:signal peptidase I [Bailinhaonella thermotolerans]RJL21788.1 signal peptidase I [Bailinhaonella thermotolerans]